MRLAILAASLAALSLAACAPRAAVLDNSDTPTAAMSNTGGPCGDGTILRANERCP